MIYIDFIQNIIDTRGRFGCGSEYHERHHITPRCLGGADEEDNLIDLYAREHFIAHKLLAQENPNNKKLTYAWWMMSHCVGGNNAQRYLCTAEEYEEARIAFSKYASEKQKGKPCSEETKKKISETEKGKKLSEETKKKISEAGKGRKHTEEAKKKMSICRKGKGKAVAQYDNDYNLIKVYDTARQAMMELGIHYSAICKCCSGTNKTAGGFKWAYA